MTPEKRTPPNLSDRINPKNCEKCGSLCCKQFWIWYPADANALKLSELSRFQMIAGLQDIVEVVDCGYRGYKLIIKLPCSHLKQDGRCAIYNHPDRPLLCRKFPHPGDTPDECPYIGGVVR